MVGGMFSVVVVKRKHGYPAQLGLHEYKSSGHTKLFISNNCNLMNKGKSLNEIMDPWKLLESRSLVRGSGKMIRGKGNVRTARSMVTCQQSRRRDFSKL